MNDLLIELVGNIIWAFLGFGSLYFYRLLFIILPTKRLWQIRDPKNLIICTATSTITDTGKYHRPATGIGQVRALLLLNTSLSRAYKGIKIKNILLSEDQLQNRIENDLILLGGPKNNKVTRRLLDKLKAFSVVDQTESTILWKMGETREAFTPKVKGKKVLTDYGLIIRMKNPFSSFNSTVCLFSGGHTYGTIAAARYFTENLYKQAKWKEIGQNIIVVVSCEINDGHPVNIHLKKIYIF